MDSSTNKLVTALRVYVAELLNEIDRWKPIPKPDGVEMHECEYFVRGCQEGSPILGCAVLSVTSGMPVPIGLCVYADCEWLSGQCQTAELATELAVARKDFIGAPVPSSVPGDDPVENICSYLEALENDD